MDFHIAIMTLLCGSCVTFVNFAGHSDEHLESKTRHNDIISQHMMVTNDQDNRHPAPITALDVMYGAETPLESGIYICYSTSKHGPPITNIQVFAGKRKEFPIQDGYERIAKDLNQGAEGKYIYLCYTTCTAFPPVTAINVIHDDTAHVYPETAEWTRIGQNCSEGTHATEHTYVIFKY